MKIIGVIPSRYQSSRFPGKPLADICGKPMVWWVYQQCLKVPQLDEVWVATDDQRIINVCQKYDIKVKMTDSSHQTGTDRLCEVAEYIDADYYVNIQGDEPLIEPSTIQILIQAMKQNKEYMVFNTMTTIENSDDLASDTVVKVAAADSGRLLYLSRSKIPYPKKGQEYPYYKHMGLYGMSKQAVDFFRIHPRGKIENAEDIEMFRFLENGQAIKILEVTSQTIAVDRPEDIEKIERQMSILGK